MEETMTVAEVIASIVRHGKRILIVTLAAAVLAGCYKGYQQSEMLRHVDQAEEMLETQYQEALADYEAKKAVLERKLESAERKMTAQAAYVETSPYMAIDPSNMYMTKTQVAATCLSLSQGHQNFASDESGVSNIWSYYQAAWDSADLSTALRLGNYSGVLDAHLREIVTMEECFDGILTITAYGATPEDAEELAEAVYFWLEEQCQTVSASTSDHELLVVAQTTKNHADHEWATEQVNMMNNLEDAAVKVSNASAQLEQLTAPVRGTVCSAKMAVWETVKFLAIGAAGGLFLACAFLFVMGLFRNRLEVSHQLKRSFGLTYLGRLSMPAGFFAKIADRIAGERRWCDSEQALVYAAQNIAACMHDEKNVLLLSTLNEIEALRLQRLTDMLGEKGCRAEFVPGAGQDQKTAAAAGDAACVVLAEEIGCSDMKAISDLMETVKQYGKPVKGFVLL